MKHFFSRRWFLFALAIVFVLGIGFSAELQPLNKMAGIRYGIVAVVLFLMALPVEAGAIWQAVRRPWAPLLAVAVNFGLLPLVAWGISFGLQDELGLGLLIAATTPCTLASASVWTRRAGGNDSVAIMVTIVTNAICFLVTPMWLVLMIGESPSLQPLELVVKLALLVVLPMTFAQLIRTRKTVGRWATKNKIPLGVVAQCGILSMIFLGAIRTGQILSGTQSKGVTAADYAVMIIVVLGVHVIMLAVGMWIARAVGMSRPDQIAVGISGSQKTLMVGLQNGMELHITIIPMVIYHVGQLLIDTFIADVLRHRGNGKRVQKSIPLDDELPDGS